MPRSRRTSSTRLTILALCTVILILASFIRLHRLNNPSFWLDEIHSLERAELSTWSERYDAIRAKNHAPLFEAIILHNWLSLDDSPPVLRLPALFFGVLTVAVVFALGRRLSTPSVALLGALLLALSPVHIHYSRETRMYTLVTLLVALAFYCLVRLYHPPARQRSLFWLGYIIFGALALYTHYYAAFSLLAFALAAVVIDLHGRKWRRLAQVSMAHVAILMLFGPWLPTFWSQLQGNPVAWLPEPTAELVASILGRIFLDPLTLGRAYPFLAGLLLLVIAFGLIQFFRRRRLAVTSTLFLVTAATIGPLLLALLVSIVKPVIFERYLLVAVPPGALLAAVVLRSAASHYLGRIGVFLLLAVVAFSAYGVATIDRKPDWKGVASLLQANARQEDLIVVTPGTFINSLNFHYKGSQEIRAFSGEVAEPSLELAYLQESPRIWLITVMPNAAQNSPGTLQFINANFPSADCWRFGKHVFHVQLCLYARQT